MASISRILPTDGRLTHCPSWVHAPTRKPQTHLDSFKLLPVDKAGISLRIQNSSRPLCSVFALESASSSRSRRVACNAATDMSGDAPESSTPKELSQYEKTIELLTTLFPLWVILGTLVGIFKPSLVTWLETDLFTLGLGFLMLSMGLTLTFEDFRRCLRNPWTVGVGFLAQYMIKPLLGFLIAMTLKLSAPLATGLILVSCCPGGQASNVATYISKGNVALSVLMTTYIYTSISHVFLLNMVRGLSIICCLICRCSTIGAIIMTPLLTKLLAGQLVPVDAAGLAVSTFQVVLVPTIVGVLANEFFPKFLANEFFPKFTYRMWDANTFIVFEKPQSSALGFLLAQKHFTNPLVAVPSAVSVVCMALGGSGLAVFWRNQPIPKDDKDDFKE
ncbi:unnamed protein product [Eruca vesicaria subsp. sativa]|uniref:Uncharacterized protein n=1 Tax=Eruca vesicaria subsp. sativa TaxID=29727 RepID=A0ABC8L4N8_ERUVS|nr:unnamed protein product [Eruca vesicaria subsp. sativa]